MVGGPAIDIIIECFLFRWYTINKLIQMMVFYADLATKLDRLLPVVIISHQRDSLALRRAQDTTSR